MLPTESSWHCLVLSLPTHPPGPLSLYNKESGSSGFSSELSGFPIGLNTFPYFSTGHLAQTVPALSLVSVGNMDYGRYGKYKIWNMETTCQNSLVSKDMVPSKQCCKMYQCSQIHHKIWDLYTALLMVSELAGMCLHGKGRRQKEMWKEGRQGEGRRDIITETGVTGRQVKV